MKKINLALISLGVMMLAAGCGGGGGGTSGGTTIPTAAVQITQANATVVAAGSITSSQTMVKTGSGQASVVGVVAENSAHARSVLDISLAEFNRPRSMKFSPVVAGIISSVTLNCAGGGTVTGSLQDTNNNNSFDVNEILTLTFNSCVELATATANSTTMNGSATFSIAELNGTKLGASPSIPFTAGFTLTFSNFSNRDNITNLTETINGDIGFSTDDDGTNTTGTMSGTSLRMDSSVDGAFLLTNFNISFTEANLVPHSAPYSFSVNMTAASTVANGSVTIATTTLFTGVGIGDPTAGAMLITGANGSTLTLTALPDGLHVRLVVDEDGAGGAATPVTIINPATQTDYTWAEL